MSNKTDNRFEDVVFCIEATYEEQLQLWCRWHRIVDWKEDSKGIWQEIGKIKDMPICVTVFFAIINGKRICFYEGSSLVVHYGMIKSWVKKQCSPVWDDHRSAFTNASNFHHVLEVVAPNWHDNPEKKKIFDDINKALNGD